MTNRDFIRDRHRLSPALAKLLQPDSPFDVLAIPITIKICVAYGQSWRALTSGSRIALDTAWFARCNTRSFLQVLAHELFHVEEYKRQGWLSHAWEWLLGIRASRIKGSPYLHGVIPEEIEAEARRRKVLTRLEEKPGWENLLDSEVA